ncbi:4776_t:CDS:2, partial [Diversispora eburnea]
SSDQSNLSCDILREQKNNQSKIKSPCPELKLSTDQAQSDIPELSDIPSQITEASTLVIKIPYNWKVEQGLLHELFEFIRGTDSMSLQSLKKTPLNSIFIKQISNISVDIDLTPGSVPHLALSNLSSEKNIGDQMARTQIYDEMMQYLPELDAKVSSSESQKYLYYIQGVDKYTLAEFNHSALILPLSPLAIRRDIRKRRKNLISVKIDRREDSSRVH